MKTINKTEKNNLISPTVVTIVGFSIFSALYYGSFLLRSENIDNFILYALLILVELYVIITYAFTWWTIMFHDKGVAIPNIPRSAFKQLKEKKLGVILVTMNEPLDLIEETIKAAKNLKHNPNVYIGDDGNRKEVMYLAEKYQIGYFTRTDNKHSKSGNITNILKEIDDDFVALFDIDHKPEENFFEVTLPYFYDNDVAFVQTPQFYSNTENIISKGASGAQSIFYELIMPGKNAFNSAICVGTNVIFRTEALRKSLDGGIYLLDHSEDIYTGLTLHADGWKSIYIPRVLAKGLAPDTTSSFFRQQLRWARGGFSILFNLSDFFKKKLTIEQKSQYLFSVLHYFSGFVVLFYLLMPIIYLLIGAKPIEEYNSSEWFIHFMPFMISKFLLIFYLMDEFDIALLSTSIALFPVYIKAFFLELLGSKYKWTVTNIRQQDFLADYLVWHVFILLLSIMSVIVGILTAENKITAYTFAFWAIINVILLTHFILGSINAERRLDVK